MTEARDFEDLAEFAGADFEPFYGDAAADLTTADIGLDPNEDHTLTRLAAGRKFKNALQLNNARKTLRVLPGPGETIHFIMKGNFNAWDLVPTVLRMVAPETIRELNLATLGFNKRIIEELTHLVDSGKIGRVTFICSSFFRTNEDECYEHAASELSRRGFPCLSLRCHAKLTLFELTDDRFFAFESSANLRSCRNIEQASLTQDRGLVEFHRGWMNDLFEQAPCEDGNQHPPH